MVGQYPDISASKEVLGGTPVFKGTRVPVQTFLDYLEGGYSIDEFLEEFPTVKKGQVISVLEWLRNKVLEKHEIAAR